MNNTGLNGRHDALEREIDKKMQDNGYISFSMAYHDVLPPDVTDIIAKNYSPTPQDLRTRNDRVYIKADGKDVVFAEMKTHTNKKLNDCCLELDPFVRHLTSSWVGTECVYTYKNPNIDDATRAFYADDNAACMVARIYIPQLGRLSDMENKQRTEHYTENVVGLLCQFKQHNKNKFSADRGALYRAFYQAGTKFPKVLSVFTFRQRAQFPERKYSS